MPAYFYFLREAGADATHALDSAKQYGRGHLPPEIQDVFLFSDAQEDARLPLIERNSGQELLRTVRQGDHVLFAEAGAFAFGGDAIETLGTLALRGAAVHFVAEQFLIEPQSAVSQFIGLLKKLDVQTRSFEHTRRKALARRRQKAMNQHSEYGWSYAVDDHGVRHKVPNERERDVMRWLLLAKDEQNLTWDEIHLAARKKKIASRSGNLLSLKGLRRRYAAAKELFKGQ